MKKFILQIALAILVIFGITACSKSKEPPTIDNQINEKKSSEVDLINKSAILQITNMPESEQKSAYRLLNSSEMAYLWRNKFSNFKTKETLTKDQESFINDMLSIIKPDLFIINSASNIQFRSTVGKSISERAKKLFGLGNATNLLATISSNKGGVTPNYVDLKDCKCATVSNYCDPLAPCDLQLETACHHTTWGCGTFLFYSCDGKCR